jgi:hypothetical protein
MYKFTIMIAALYSIILPAMHTAVQAKDNVVNNDIGNLTMDITEIDISGKALKLTYEIRNDSKQHIWILTGLGKFDVNASVFMEKDGQTLLIRRRLYVPFSGGGNIVHGRYVLLHAGQAQTESVTLSIPVYSEHGFAGKRNTEGLEYATRLSIEIGYYSEDLPGMIRGILEKADKIGKNINTRDEEVIRFYFRGTLYYNKISEILRQRDEEILVPYTYQWFKGEKVLEAIVEDLRIPYEEKVDRSAHYLPELPACTQIEVRYQPSALEYFFPYMGQQSLLNRAEKKYLQSVKNIVVDNPGHLKVFANDFKKGANLSGIVCQRSTADVVCYRDDERLMSFTIYNDSSIVTEGRYRFVYPNGFQSLRMITPKIQPIDFRINCAANLRNLWNRIRLYYKVDKKHPVDSTGKSEILYPSPSSWCAAIVHACRTIDMFNEEIIRPFICPAITESKSYLAKSYYAMNLDCKYDSPPDTVLLFETKAGWNQHGGPELFTFDNHDPKGGCVLLNDGTVKFIRTKEELQQLRWK